VTVYCGGPMTNLALAAMLAPDIVPITKEVIFMGGGIHHSTSSVNVYFDAEAAKIGFRAGWPKFTLVTTDLAEQVHMQDDGKVDTSWITPTRRSPICSAISSRSRSAPIRKGNPSACRMK
jgi:inosine-uridine nucleoside N-ribohydrolase